MYEFCDIQLELIFKNLRLYDTLLLFCYGQVDLPDLKLKFNISRSGQA